jgi:hypothetical protein
MNLNFNKLYSQKIKKIIVKNTLRLIIISQEEVLKNKLVEVKVSFDKEEKLGSGLAHSSVGLNIPLSIISAK